MVNVSVDTTSVRYFRSNVAEIMGTLGLSQGQVAERAGITRVHLNRILGGKTVPGLDMAESVAKALGVSVVRLLKEPKEVDETSSAKTA